MLIHRGQEELSCANRWFVCRSERPQAALRMFCLPYAGAGASVFNSWSNSFPDTIELQAVQLPGRESRYNEPMFTDIHEAVKVLADSIKLYMDRPYAFFGYSMGALVAFELMRELRRRGEPLPIQLFLAAMRAPQTSPICPSLADLPNDSFLEQMRHYYDPPQDAWNLPELLKVILPTLRADMKMCEGYIHTLEPPLESPIHAFAGQDDRSASPAVVREWRQQTTEDFKMDVFDGTHFFINTALDDLQRVMIARLNNIVRRS